MGNTLGELLGKFSEASDSGSPDDDTNYEQVLEDENEKIASDGGTAMSDGMGSLANLYLSMTEMDKTAAAVAEAPEFDEDEALLTEEDLEKIATAEAAELIEQEEYSDDEPEDMLKVAAEYDAAGRLMARGFMDEMNKLANAMDTSVAPNQGADAESQSSSESFGNRGLVTLDTNYAGAPQAGIKGKAVPMNTSGGKAVYKDVLKPNGKGSAGEIVGQRPDKRGVGDFATVQDVMGSNR